MTCSFAGNFDILAHNKISIEEFTVQIFISGKFRNERYRPSTEFGPCRQYFVSYIQLFTPENVILKFYDKVMFLLSTSFNHFEYPRQSPYLFACNGYPNSERLSCMWSIRNVGEVSVLQVIKRPERNVLTLSSSYFSYTKYVTSSLFSIKGANFRNVPFHVLHTQTTNFSVF